MDSDRKLRRMLDESKAMPNEYKCLSNVEVRIEENPNRPINIPSNSTVEIWKCSHCSAEFRSKKLKLNHEANQHANDSLFESTILIHDDDSDSDDNILPNITEVDVEVDENELNPLDQEPEMDLGLYLMEKNSQISNFDPLDENNASDSLLVPMEVYPPSIEFKISNDINNKWSCRICSKSFRTRDLLREHHRLHMAEKRHSKSSPKPSPKNNQKPSPSKVLKRSSDIVGPSVEKSTESYMAKPPISRWECQTCFLNFQTRDLLREHRRLRCGKDKSREVKKVSSSQQSKKRNFKQEIVEYKDETCDNFY